MIYLGSNSDVLRTLPSASVHACVTDPPYEISMSRADWDSSGVAFDAGLWREVFRVLKPGGHLLAFGSPRTFHRLMVAVETAGFELRDTLLWLYGGGWPHGVDVSKAIDKQAGATRPVLGEKRYAEGRHVRAGRGSTRAYNLGWAALPALRVDTAPATDDARRWAGWHTTLKPCFEPIVMARKPLNGTVVDNVLAHGAGALNIAACRTPEGRWPATAILDEDAACALEVAHPGTSRFFYCPKVHGSADPYNTHPTVKPTALMRWLVRLSCPRSGTVLDPFSGSGSTGVACAEEGCEYIGIEKSREYLAIGERRYAEAWARARAVGVGAVGGTEVTVHRRSAPPSGREDKRPSRS